MKVAFAAAEFPSQIITNATIAEHIKENSKGVFEGDLEKFLKQFDLLLNLSGAQQRRWISTNTEQVELTHRLLERLRRQGVD